MLRQSGLNFITADEMGDAARKVVAAAGGVPVRKAESAAEAEKPKAKSKAKSKAAAQPTAKKKKGAK
jgi:hypothetical protein